MEMARNVAAADYVANDRLQQINQLKAEIATLTAQLDEWQQLATGKAAEVADALITAQVEARRLRLALETLRDGMKEKPTFPPIQLQDGKSPEWTCQQCGGDALFCGCKRKSFTNMATTELEALMATAERWLLPSGQFLAQSEAVKLGRDLLASLRQQAAPRGNGVLVPGPKLAEMREAIRRLRLALETYGQHKADCHKLCNDNLQRAGISRCNLPDDCTCGFRAELDALLTAHAETGAQP